MRPAGERQKEQRYLHLDGDLSGEEYHLRQKFLASGVQAELGTPRIEPAQTQLIGGITLGIIGVGTLDEVPGTIPIEVVLNAVPCCRQLRMLGRRGRRRGWRRMRRCGGWRRMRRCGGRRLHSGLGRAQRLLHELAGPQRID